MDFRISVKAIAERCGLEVRKMTKPIIKVRGESLRAIPYRFHNAQTLKHLFSNFKRSGVMRIYLYSVTKPKGSKMWLVRLCRLYDKKTQAALVEWEKKIKGELGAATDAKAIEKRMRTFEFKDGKVGAPRKLKGKDARDFVKRLELGGTQTGRMKGRCGIDCSTPNQDGHLVNYFEWKVLDDFTCVLICSVCKVLKRVHREEDKTGKYDRYRRSIGPKR